MKPLIFIIDESSVYRRVVKECLLSLGYSNIETFDHPREVLSLYRNPQIIILDTNGNDTQLSGMEFFRLYGHTRFRQSRFIFLSSNSNLSTAVSAMRMGAYDYILKSKSGLDRLVSKIESLARSYKKKYKLLWTFRAALISLAGFVLLLGWAVLQYNQ